MILGQTVENLHKCHSKPALRPAPAMLRQACDAVGPKHLASLVPGMAVETGSLVERTLICLYHLVGCIVVYSRSLGGGMWANATDAHRRRSTAPAATIVSMPTLTPAATSSRDVPARKAGVVSTEHKSCPRSARNTNSDAPPMRRGTPHRVRPPHARHERTRR